MNTIQSVWKKIDQRGPDECWPWTGYTSSGYGRIDICGSKGVYAHRAAYIAAFPGSLPLKDDGSDQDVLHHCDNPVCCNPNHLFIGTHAENMEDKRKKGRAPRLTGERGPRAKLTSEDVFWIRLQKKHGATKKALALLYEVSEATISGCCYGRHYRDVPS